MEKRKLFAFVLVLSVVSFLSIVIIGTSTISYAAQSYPILDDSKDYSNIGKTNYTNENGYIIQSYDLTAEEIYLGQRAQELHNDYTLARHFNLTPHTHSIRDVKIRTPKSYVWRPSTIWTRNSLYKNSADWPTVSWETSVSKTEGASVNTSAGVTTSVVSAAIGAEYKKSHTISTSTTRTFKIPYQKDGRVIVKYKRPYSTFTCVTTYVFAGPPLTQWEETGSGSALGAPYEIICTVELKNIV